MSNRGQAAGRFTFSAAEAGEHKICFTPSSNSGRQGWLSSHDPNGGIKLQLDLAIGETSQIESTDKGKMEDLSQRVKDLNSRLQDIRREQVFQRVSGSLPLRRAGAVGPRPRQLTGVSGERNERPSSETSLSRPTRVSFAGWSFKSSFLPPPAHGSFRI